MSSQITFSTFEIINVILHLLTLIIVALIMGNYGQSWAVMVNYGLLWLTIILQLWVIMLNYPPPPSYFFPSEDT